MVETQKWALEPDSSFLPLLQNERTAGRARAGAGVGAERRERGKRRRGAHACQAQIDGAISIRASISTNETHDTSHVGESAVAAAAAAAAIVTSANAQSGLIVIVTKRGGGS